MEGEGGREGGWRGKRRLGGFSEAGMTRGGGMWGGMEEAGDFNLEYMWYSKEIHSYCNVLSNV